MRGQTPDWQAVMKRLERVERENRRLKRLGLFVLCGFLGLFVMGQRPARGRIVEAEEFRLVDTGGNTRALLQMSGPEPCLSLNIQFAEPRADVCANGITLRGSNSEHTADINSRSVKIVGPAARAEISVDRPGAPPDFRAGVIHLEGINPSQNSAAGRIILAAYADQGAAIRLMPSESLSRGAWLRMDKDGQPSLTLGDERGKAVLGHTELVTTRTGVVERRPPSSLVLFDKDDKVLWQAP